MLAETSFIILILLGAAIIGFVTAWLYFRNIIQRLTAEKEKLQTTCDEFSKAVKGLNTTLLQKDNTLELKEEEIESIRLQLANCQKELAAAQDASQAKQQEFEALSTQINALKKEAETRQQEAKEKLVAFDALTSAKGQLEKTLSDKTQLVEKLHNELEQATENRNNQELKLAECGKEREIVVKENEGLKSENAKLQEMLEKYKTGLANIEGEMATLIQQKEGEDQQTKERLEGLMADKDAMQAKLSDFKTHLAKSQAQLQDCQKGQKEMEKQLQDAKVKVIHLESQKEEKPMVSSRSINAVADLSAKALEDPDFPTEELDIDVVKADYASMKDDLKLIKGVGPYTEMKLNAIGIRNFKQIMNLKLSDVDKVNDAIKFFPGRILRDDWIGQAKELEGKKG